MSRPAWVQVLYLTEPIDEPALNSISEYEGKKFVDVTREGLELAGAEEDGKKKVCACRCAHAGCALVLAVLLPQPWSHSHVPIGCLRLLGDTLMQMQRARLPARGRQACSDPGLRPPF